VRGRFVGSFDAGDSSTLYSLEDLGYRDGHDVINLYPIFDSAFL